MGVHKINLLFVLPEVVEASVKTVGEILVDIIEEPLLVAES